MSKLAIKGLLAITTALWLPAHADSTRAPWMPESRKESHNRVDLEDVAENSSVLLPTRFKPEKPR